MQASQFEQYQKQLIIYPMLAPRKNNAYISYLQTLLQTVAITLFLYISVVNQPPINSSTSLSQIQVQPFKFHVFCPLKSKTDPSFNELLRHLGITSNLTIDRILQQFSSKQVYVVFMKAFPTDPAQPAQSPVLLGYCGSARLWNETNCDNAKLVCTIPGPMFYLPVGQAIDIVWVNKINGTGLNWNEDDGNCYDPNTTATHCYLETKLNSSTEECTFLSPTDLRINISRKVKTSPQRVPVSPHIHGLQNRPVFDGSPYSWFNNVGDKGIGYFSVSSNKYFQNFNEPLSFLSGLLTEPQQQLIKVSHNKNAQLPGFCIYHDHAMHSTQYNVVKGLAGLYILYNESAEANYPKGDEEIFVVFHFHNQGDSRDPTMISYFGSKSQVYVGPLGDTMFMTGQQYLYRNMTYRFRFLNAHFDTSYFNFSIAVFFKQALDVNNFPIFVETDPPLYSDSFLNDAHLINFTVIGADSSLFHQPISGINRFDLASGERLQFLAKFDNLPVVVTKVYIICYDALQSIKNYVVKAIFDLKSDKKANKYMNPIDFTKINLGFSNLSAVPASNITAIRSRALFSRPVQQLFTINMHPHFQQSGSQNPKIGSIEDWYIVNTVSEVHPIHFHLVNFQVVHEYSLKVSPQGCTLFQLDYFRQSNISQFQIASNAELCYYLNNLTMEIVRPMFDRFNQYYLEDRFTQTDLGIVSGKHVMQKISNQTESSKYHIAGCTLGGIYKYICENTTDQVAPWYKRWKDTAGIRGFHLSVLRIRWTRTLYGSDNQIYPYFNFDEDAMVEFPGIPYHCHILPHEQNMMMRSILLQYSDQYLKRRAATNATFICSDGNWAERYQCLNALWQCPAPAEPQNSSSNSSTTVNVEPFQFHVHCPIKNRTDIGFGQFIAYSQITNSSHINQLEAAFYSSETYIVFVRAFPLNSSQIGSPLLMSYCGSARQWNETDCSNAKLVCTIPGPMFYIAVDQQIDVIWVNQINGTGLNWAETQSNCYNTSNTDPTCNIDAKTTNYSDCTFYSLEDYGSNHTKKVRISPQHVPISPHIHGLQNRPVFDGNPYSWFDNSGQKGIGFFSQQNSRYFNHFINTQLFFNGSQLSFNLTGNIKVTRLNTFQPPGMCFYHDHALKTTSYNNMKGLSGIFIIHNQTLQQDYPNGNEEIFVIFNFHNEGDIRNANDLPQSDPNLLQQSYVSPFGDSLYTNGVEYFYRNMTYRFRFLNGHFDSIYINISFVSFYKESKDSNGNIIQTEIQPSLSEVNSSIFEQNMKYINFTVIGTDSVLLDRVIKEISKFTLASAERLELLIKFDTVPANISKVYLICFDGADYIKHYVVKVIFKLKNDIIQNKYKNPGQYNSLPLPFADLKQTSDSDIAMLRMRALFSRPIQQMFTINLHSQFQLGGSQSPKIGTTEDWYIINTVSELHPIHLHLVNFQVLYEYSLKTINQGCTLYELDYFRQSNISIFKIDNDTDLCNLLNTISMDTMMPFFDTFNHYHSESELYSLGSQRMSGKNVMEPLNNETRDFADNCTMGGTYRYICDNMTVNMAPWYSRWKDTAGIKGNHVTVLRIRWARVLYDPTVQLYPYFFHSEDTLMQFPGFVYHCHILPHEQNMMMRTIMLQPSDHYLKMIANSTQSTCSGATWLKNYQCLNAKLSC